MPFLSLISSIFYSNMLRSKFVPDSDTNPCKKKKAPDLYRRFLYYASFRSFTLTEFSICLFVRFPHECTYPFQTYFHNKKQTHNTNVLWVCMAEMERLELSRRFPDLLP